jgi:hypothetical protein
MYCAACGTPLAPGLSYCNRCGASLRDGNESKSNSAPAFLAAITVITVAGLGIMLGGAVKLSREAQIDPQLVGFFLLFSFIIILVTEVLLFRQLSRSNSVKQNKVAPQQFPVAPDVRALPARAPGEPIPSVTENTTRTLDYSRNQS